MFVPNETIGSYLVSGINSGSPLMTRTDYQWQLQPEQKEQAVRGISLWRLE
jgi:hypothetical protein